jgi:dTDP-4-amino-4,6-dideoxygalactose transaminase
MRLLRNHGMMRERENLINASLAFDADGTVNPWYYEVAEISHNFRASDLNCALGASQVAKLGRFLDRRRSLIARYRRLISPLEPAVRFIVNAPGTEPGWHLCSILVDFERIGIDRHLLMARLKARGIGTQVHYIPVHLQPFYQQRYGQIDLPGAMRYYNRTLTLPLFPSMIEADVDRVVGELEAALRAV